MLYRSVWSLIDLEAFAALPILVVTLPVTLP